MEFLINIHLSMRALEEQQLFFVVKEAEKLDDVENNSRSNI